MTAFLCSFEISTSSSYSTDGFLSGYLGQLSLTCNQKGPFHQISGILVSKLPLLPSISWILPSRNILPINIIAFQNFVDPASDKLIITPLPI